MSGMAESPDANADSMQLTTRAIHLLDIGRAEDAVALIADGLTSNPSSTALLRQAARAEMLRGNPPAAMAAARSAVELQPDSAANLLMLARALRSNGDIDEGVKVANAAVSAAPHLGDAYYIRSLLLLDGARARIGRARQQYLGLALNDVERSIELDPANSTRFAVRGICLTMAGRHPAAKQSFHRALEIDPNDPLALNALSDHATAIDDVSEARIHTAAGLRVNPQHRILRQRIGKLALRRLIWPIWFASVPAFIGLMARASAHPEPPTLTISISIWVATMCSIGFAWWAWRRTPTVERNSLISGESRWTARLGTMAWLTLTVVGAASAFDIPFPGRDPRRPDTQLAGLVEVALGIGTFLFYSIPVLVLISWAAGLPLRFNRKFAESRERGGVQPGSVKPGSAVKPGYKVEG